MNCQPELSEVQMKDLEEFSLPPECIKKSEKNKRSRRRKKDKRSRELKELKARVSRYKMAEPVAEILRKSRVERNTQRQQNLNLQQQHQY